MDQRLDVLLKEYSEFQSSERASRDMIYKINTFAAAITSGTFVAITNYNIKMLALTGPLIFYLVGYQCSFELLRLLRLSYYLRETEREIRAVLKESGKEINAGFQSEERYRGLLISCSLMYLAIYIVFYYLLATSPYSFKLKATLITLYLVIGCLLWGYDLWLNRKYLLRSKSSIRLTLQCL